MNNEGKVILIGGKKGVGKSTLASGLLNHFESARIENLADPLKKQVYDLNPWVFIKDSSTPDLIPIKLKEFVDKVGWDVAKQELEVRQMLQNYGSVMKKHHGWSFWVKKKYSAIKNTKKGSHLIIPDFRYTYEASYVASIVGTNNIILIYLSGNEDSEDTHSSESLTVEDIYKWIKETIASYNWSKPARFITIDRSKGVDGVLSEALEFING